MSTAPATIANLTAQLHQILKDPAQLTGDLTLERNAVAELITCGADVQMADDAGLPPLLRVLSWPCTRADDMPRRQLAHDILSLLLLSGAPLDAVTPEGARATDLAAVWEDDGLALEKIDRETYRRSDPVLHEKVSGIPTDWPRPTETVTDDFKSDFCQACNRGELEKVYYFIHHWPDAKNWADPASFDTTGLMQTVLRGAEAKPVFDLLLGLGCDVNQQNSRGETALMFAVVRYNISGQFITPLVDANADETIKDENGETALTFAEHANLEDARTLLHSALDARQQRRRDAAAARQNAINEHLRADPRRNKFKL